VFLQAASNALYERLRKGGYHYFYDSIGPRFWGVELEDLGFPSGLFVASRYPLESPKFRYFQHAEFPMNYGVFSFVLRKGAVQAQIYTTHMQSLAGEEYVKTRALQLEEILEEMQQDAANTSEKRAYFLCGDLNVPWGAGERAENLIRTYFSGDYQERHSAIDENTATCTYYLTNYFLSSSKKAEEIDPHFQILDYALVLRPCVGYQIETNRIQMYDLNIPEGAISDHHGLLTRIRPSF
jgi:hypothetical protein